MTSTLDDILSVEMTPDWHLPDVRYRLAKSIDEAYTLQAAVAYWTVPPDFVHTDLAGKLGMADAFLAVDVHSPTDIDQLAGLARRGGSVRLFCEDITTQTEDGRKEPAYLLHTKMLLFLMANETAELWIGSHNWTRRALVGLNVECSLVVRMKLSSSLLLDAKTYLGKIRQITEPFDLSKIEYYKQLQQRQAETTMPTVEIEAQDAGMLQGLAITVFGTDPSEVTEVGALRKMYVSAFAEASGWEYVYEAVVAQSGLLSSASPAAGGLSFTDRRYAYRVGSSFPKLLQPSPVTLDTLGSASYFVVIHIGHRRDDLMTLDPPARSDPWARVSPKMSPLFNRLNAEQISTLFRGRTPTVREGLSDDFGTYAPLAPVLEERRSLTRHRLIVRKLLRPRVT